MQGTFTPKLSNMLGTQHNCCTVFGADVDNDCDVDLYASFQDYKTTLKRFVEFVGETASLEDVPPSDVTRFIADVRSSRGVSAATVNKYKRNLKAIFNIAITQLGYLNINPCAHSKEDRIADKALRFITAEEYGRLQQACTIMRDRTLWWQAFLSVCYTGGCRMNEATHLTWNDIDFEADKLRIISKPETAGIGAWRPKDYDSRVVPIPTHSVDLLTRLHAIADEGAVFVFLSPKRIAWISAKRKAGTWSEGQKVINNLDRDYKRIAKAAGVADVCLHDLRRSALTHWAKRLPAAVVKELADHGDIKTTLKYYVSLRAADLDEARTVMEAALSTCS